MKARISPLCQNQMQSGKRKQKYWLLEYINITPPVVEGVMGWQSAGSTYKQVKLKFPSEKDAINFAIQNKIDYDLVRPNERKIQIRSYADNFK